MVVAAMKYMASNFAKLDKFKGVDLRRWQKKMHFLVSNMSVVYVLTTPIPEDGENATMEQIRKRNKWDNDDYVCRGLVLNAMADFTQYKNKLDEANLRSLVSLINSFPSWKGFQHTLKNRKEELTRVELAVICAYEESLMVSDNDKPKHAKAFRFYVIKPNELVSINSIIKSMDAIYDENRFLSVPRPSQRSLINGTEDIGASMVPKKVIEEVLVQQPEPELRKSKMNRAQKNFRPKF
ncbi:hypothetical protein Tco_0468852 [Tanacetum coccineum]